MLIKFWVRQKLKTMCEEYKTLLEDKKLSDDECEEVVDVIIALESAISELGEEQ